MGDEINYLTYKGYPPQCILVPKFEPFDNARYDLGTSKMDDLVSLLIVTREQRNQPISI